MAATLFILRQEVPVVVAWCDADGALATLGHALRAPVPVQFTLFVVEIRLAFDAAAALFVGEFSGGGDGGGDGRGGAGG